MAALQSHVTVATLPTNLQGGGPLRDSRRRSTVFVSQVVSSPVRRRVAGGGVSVAAVEKKDLIAF
jgi:hypothetical protein